MSAELTDAKLPESYASGPATSADVSEAFEVFAAEMSSVFGFCPHTQEDMRSVLVPPDGALATNLLVRDRGGDPVQWWSVTWDHGDPSVWAWIRTHPKVPADDGDELSRVGFAAMVDWITTRAPAGQNEVLLKSGCPAGGETGHRHLAAAGFEHRRTFWEMVGPVNDTTRAAPPVPRLTVDPVVDEHLVHRVLDDCFTGHYGYEPHRSRPLAWCNSLRVTL